jgi:hypothetical protein
MTRSLSLCFIFIDLHASGYINTGGEYMKIIMSKNFNVVSAKIDSDFYLKNKPKTLQ